MQKQILIPLILLALLGAYLSYSKSTSNYFLQNSSDPKTETNINNLPEDKTNSPNKYSMNFFDNLHTKKLLHAAISFRTYSHSKYFLRHGNEDGVLQTSMIDQGPDDRSKHQSSFIIRQPINPDDAPSGHFSFECVSELGKFLRVKDGKLVADDLDTDHASDYSLRLVPSKVGHGLHIMTKDNQTLVQNTTDHTTSLAEPEMNYGFYAHSTFLPMNANQEYRNPTHMEVTFLNSQANITRPTPQIFLVGNIQNFGKTDVSRTLTYSKQLSNTFSFSHTNTYSLTVGQKIDLTFKYQNSDVLASQIDKSLSVTNQWTVSLTYSYSFTETETIDDSFTLDVKQGKAAMAYLIVKSNEIHVPYSAILTFDDGSNEQVEGTFTSITASDHNLIIGDESLSVDSNGRILGPWKQTGNNEQISKGNGPNGYYYDANGNIQSDPGHSLNNNGYAQGNTDGNPILNDYGQVVNNQWSPGNGNGNGNGNANGNGKGNNK